MREHIADVLMGSEDGGGLSIARDEKQAKQAGEFYTRTVLMVLAFHADEDNLCWVAATTIARYLRIHESKVRFCIKILLANEYIVKVASPVTGRRGTTYRITTPSFRDIGGAQNPPKQSSKKYGRAKKADGTSLVRSETEKTFRAQFNMDSRTEGRMDSHMLACAKQEIEHKQELLVLQQNSQFLVRVQNLLSEFKKSIEPEDHELLFFLRFKIGPELLIARLKEDIESSLKENRNLVISLWLRNEKALAGPSGND